MEAELWVDGEVVPGLAAFDHGSRALATRENDCYSGVRPGNLGLYHTGCGGGPAGAGEFAIFSLGTGIMAVGEGNYGRLGETEQQRYTSRPAETQFSEPATGGTPDEQPGAMPEIFPSEPSPQATDPDGHGHAAEHRPLLDLPLDVHAGLGPLRDLLGGRPPGAGHPAEPRAALARGGPAAGRRRARARRRRTCGSAHGAADVHASRDGSAYTTKVDARGPAGPRDALGRPHAAARRDRRVGPARRRAGGDYEMPLTNRGLEVRVAADPAGVHTLVVTAG